MKLNVAVYNGNVMAFKFQSTSCEVIEVEVNPDFINEPIFTESQQNRFKVVDGVVVKKTEEELKAEPEYEAWIISKRLERYKNEVDPITLEAVRVGVSTSAGIELKKQANEKVAQIKLELPKE